MIQSSLLAVVSSEIYLYTSAVDMQAASMAMSIVQSEFKRDVRAVIYSYSSTSVEID